MPKPRRSRTLAAALVLAAAAAVLTGCSGLDFRESICRDGEYPVLQVNSTGSGCMPDDEEPMDGYVRYPEGKVPEHVDDKWDVYWRTHTLDEKGDIIPAS
ncbi:putative secreted protein [Streptomyces davaonensis JCM 4913]|uniref:Putative secreted protein n=1 Tax=Streptomyces davaonensis (strain DSM 101723 / JCM 4913 / KCC S-0913 / 768) TaxID=1214101 RepID=K4QW26_STRDJ|nr:hypothetical protein [Streptomyces davaonensis]CCK28281.1 putative secreted protein [Streptomyces davaonensis JCM 4913]